MSLKKVKEHISRHTFFMINKKRKFHSINKYEFYWFQLTKMISSIKKANVGFHWLVEIKTTKILFA